MLIFLVAVNLPQKVLSATSHVVISQIQIGASGTGNSNHEFVELYNPTNNSVMLDGWRLSKEISTGGSPSNLVASLSGTIAPHHYFLIAHPDYTTIPVTPNLLYSVTGTGITANNTVILYSDKEITIVDKVGMGTATDRETANATIPLPDQSIVRKASSISDGTSLSSGGTEEHAGNGFDSDNNAIDFVLFCDC